MVLSSVKHQKVVMQAEAIKLLSERIRDKYYVIPHTQAESWQSRIEEAQHKDLEEEGHPEQTLPNSTLSMDYRRVWHTRRTQDNQVISVWHPICPPGYHPVGDLISMGLDPPPNPTKVSSDSCEAYKNASMLASKRSVSGCSAVHKL